MDIILAIVALVVAAVSLGLVFRLQQTLQRLARSVEQQRRDYDRLHESLHAATMESSRSRERMLESERALGTLRVDLEGLRGELGAVRALAEVPAPLTLPKARSSGLEDLREQLRAAQQAAEDDDET